MSHKRCGLSTPATSIEDNQHAAYDEPWMQYQPLGYSFGA